MKIHVIEKITFTADEKEALVKAKDILDGIYVSAIVDGEIENKVWNGLGILDFLLDDEISEIE